MPFKDSDPALLALADGTLWRGVAFGARGERTGEVVFNTSLTGYQEILTDPSYPGHSNGTGSWRSAFSRSRSAPSGTRPGGSAACSTRSSR